MTHDKLIKLIDDYACEVANAPSSPTPIERKLATERIERARNAVVTELAKQAPQVPMTEDEIVRCLVESSCIGKVRLSFESGPYDITRTSINADRLVRAIEAHHGIKEKP